MPKKPLTAAAMINELIESGEPGLVYENLGHRAEGIVFTLRNQEMFHKYNIAVRSISGHLYLINKDIVKV